MSDYKGEVSASGVILGALMGQAGPKGDKGATGERGPQGEKGEKGDKGDKGATGPQGPQGEKGDKGDKGPQGEQGIQGEQGPVYDDTEIQEKIRNLDKILTRNEISGEYIYIKDSAEYPAEIVVNGNTRQEVREGYNLLAVDEEHCIQSSAIGSTITYLEDGWVQIKNNTEAITYINYASPSENIVSGKSYTLKVEFADSNKCNIFLQNSSSDYSKVMGMTGNVTNVATTNYMNALISLTASMTIKVRLTLVEGTTAKEWEAYGKAPTPDFPSEVKTVTGNVEVNISNENLFIPTLQNQTVRGIEYTLNSDNSIRMSGTVIDASVSLLLGKVNLKAGTYTFYLKGMAYERGISRIELQSSNFATKAFFKDYESIAITITETTTVSFYGIASLGNTIDYTFYPMILVGDVTSNLPNYKAHKGKTLPLTLGDIELCKIGDYADYIYRNGNKWFKRSYIMKSVLTGTETYKFTNAQPTDTTLKSYSINLTGKILGDDNVLITHYTKTSGPIADATVPCFKVNTGANVQIMIITNHLTAEELRTWLAEQYANGTPVTIYYILATPTDTEITDTTLIAQLNALENAQLYEGITIIIVITSDGINPILGLKYVESPKLVKENLQAQIDELKSAIVSLGTV